MKIYTNLAALQTLMALSNSEKKVMNQSKKLSTGFKINSSKDDAAGMAIGKKMANRIVRLEMANRNTLDGISLVQTAEGAITEVTNMLQRLRELSVQSSNETLEPEDREKIQFEVDSLKAEINATAFKTEFNGQKLLNGSLERLAFGNNDVVAKINYVSNGVAPNNFRYTIQSAGVPAKVSTSYPFNTGVDGNVILNGHTINIKKEDTSQEILKKITDVANKTGVTVLNTTTEVHLITNEFGSKEKIEIKMDNPILANSLGLTEGVIYGVDAKIDDLRFYDINNNLDTNFMNTAVVKVDGNRIDITNSNDQKISIDIKVTTHNDGKFYLGDGTVVTDAGVISQINMGGSIKPFGPMILQVGSEKNMEMEITIPELTTSSLGLTNLNLLSTQSANHSIDILDNALENVFSIRAKLGAYQNRLEYTDKNLNISTENTAISLSRIMDTDMAKEMTEYTKQTVISQAGMSILAQANQRPQQILQLLQ